MFTANDRPGWCKTCRHAYQTPRNPRTNAISSISYRMVGGSAAFYQIESKQERKKIRALATMEYEESADDTTVRPKLEPVTHKWAPSTPEELAHEDQAEARRSELDDNRAVYDTPPPVDRLNKPGYVYVITNPAWDGIVGIGVSVQPTRRIGGYQTSLPFRDMELIHAVLVDNMRVADAVYKPELLDRNTTGNIKHEFFEMGIDEAIEYVNGLPDKVTEALKELEAA